MLQSNMESKYRPVGFVADDRDEVRHSLLTLKVYPLNQDLIEKMKKQHIKKVIVSPIKMKEIKLLKKELDKM